MTNEKTIVRVTPRRLPLKTPPTSPDEALSEAVTYHGLTVKERKDVAHALKRVVRTHAHSVRIDSNKNDNLLVSEITIDPVSNMWVHIPI
jgi:hypothetical protein